MSPKEFREALARLGMSQLQAAKVLETDPRTVRRWALGESTIPGPVRVALRCMERLQALGAEYRSAN
ncbi:hypothetical protein HMPREF9946_02187 [Acetobacteraceae bacterium AT-5844]|nr:hypothetical protein HMPREF9946_02187 [Acetobacteraceae bacterium AT-5844]